MFKNFVLLLMVIIITGCAPQMQKPLPICAGKQSAGQALSFLKSNSQNTVPFKAVGQCLASFNIDEKKYNNENFPVKLWVNPPDQLRLQGDISFNARGIDLGSNPDEFWLSIKPQGRYCWGLWSEQGITGRLLIDPKMVLDAAGIVDDNNVQNWSLSNQGPFDILTAQNHAGAVIKKVYVYSCDYRVSKVQYFDADGLLAAVVELDGYREISKGFFVPSVIKIANMNNEKITASFKITLDSIRQEQFTEQRKDNLFSRPLPKGFKSVFQIIDGRLIKQQ
jgi:hypothetical protein